MNNYSIYNDPKMYEYDFIEKMELPTSSEPVFAVREGEVINHTFAGYDSASLEEVRAGIDDLDVAIVEEVARSKYLTSLHVYEYLKLRGFDVKRPRLRKRMLKLMKLRLIQENEIIVPGSVHGIKYYELDIKGNLLARDQGVRFGMGNRYLSYRKKDEMGISDTPKDVKRVLAGNQIVLGLLLSNARLERFGIMETFRVEAEQGMLDGCIVRTAATVKIDSESILAYEVVRNFSDSLDSLADKIRRYYKMVHSRKYVEANFHGDNSVPQLVICGESLDHNKKIVEFLISEGLWDEEDTILFTEDLLNMRDSLKSIYEITKEGEVRWYQLPANISTMEEERYYA